MRIGNNELLKDADMKVFNNLPTQIKELAHNRHHFKHTLKEFLYTYSFYTPEEYFNYKKLVIPNNRQLVTAANSSMT
jgi:chromosome segregation and condensation protein ScpB